MNKIFNINLGGYPFTIDEDAYQKLTQYISTIENHFSKSEGCEDIITDIEARIAELFNEELKGQPIVSMREIDLMIKTMGTPEDFGAEEIEEEPMTRKERRNSGIKTGKRLFRDSDDKKIGGVCSGLSAYFGIEDPIWIRLAFILLFFTGGISFLFYIILWVVLPEALTSADKLAMRGEKINVSNIAKMVEDEVENITESFSEFSKDFRSKKKSGRTSSFSALNPIKTGISFITGIITGVFNLVRTVLRPFLWLVLIVLGLAFTVTWLSLVVGGFAFIPYISYLTPGPSSLGYLALFSGVMAVGIPFLALTLLIVSVLTPIRTSTDFKKKMWGFWGVNALTLIGLAINFSVQSDHSTVFEELQDLGTSNIDELYVTGIEPAYNDDLRLIHLGELVINDGKLSSSDVEIRFEKTDQDHITIKKRVKASGANKNVAFQRAKEVNHHITLTENKLEIPTFFDLKKGEKYANQDIEYTIEIPEGITLKFDDISRRMMSSSNFDKTHGKPRNILDYEWHTGANGLISTEWIKKNEFTKILDHTDFKDLIVEGNIDIEIIKADIYEVSVTGFEEMVEAMESVQVEDALHLINDESRHEKPLSIQIKTPSIESIKLSEVNSAKITGFDENKISIEADDASDILADINVKYLNLDLSDRSEIRLVGTCEELVLNISNRSLIDAAKFIVKNAQIEIGSVHEDSKLSISDHILTHDPDDLRDLKIFGSPKIERIETADKEQE